MDFSESKCLTLAVTIFSPISSLDIPDEKTQLPTSYPLPHHIQVVSGLPIGLLCPPAPYTSSPMITHHQLFLFTCSNHTSPFILTTFIIEFTPILSEPILSFVLVWQVRTGEGQTGQPAWASLDLPLNRFKYALELDSNVNQPRRTILQPRCRKPQKINDECQYWQSLHQAQVGNLGNNNNNNNNKLLMPCV